MSTVKINEDSEEVISQLPGFDLNMARKVVEARNKDIFFSSIDELATFLQLKPHIIHKLEDLVSFEYTNLSNSSNSNTVKRKSHKARVLDFNISNDQTNENTSLKTNMDQNNIQSNENISIKTNTMQNNLQINENTFNVMKNNSINDVQSNAENEKLNEHIKITQSNVNTEIITSNENHKFKICPKCKEENEIENKFCVYCGINLQNVNSNNNHGFKICPNCKEKNELDHKYCVYCGNKLSEINLNENLTKDTLPQPNKNTNHKSRKLDF